MATFESFPAIKGDRKKGKQGKVSNKEAFGFLDSVCAAHKDVFVRAFAKLENFYPAKK